MKVLLVLSLVPLISFASDRGIYFGKKEYSPERLPTYEESFASIPQPILDDHPEWIRLYDKAWAMAFKNLKAPVKGSHLVSNYIDAAWWMPHLFQWDSMFMIEYGRYAHAAFPFIRSLDNFYANQHRDGYISREIVSETGEDFLWDQETIDDTFGPPLFAWTEVRYAKFTGDRSRYPLVYPSLVKLADFVENARRSPRTKHGLYWTTNLASGMDDLGRTGSGWVDMSAQVVVMYKNLSTIALALERAEDAARFGKRAKEISARIQKFMWSEKDGAYYDVDDEGRQIPRRMIAGYWPMFAGIATRHQMDRMIRNLRDPRLFWRPTPWPALAAIDPMYHDDGSYWRGGVWTPTNSMISSALHAHPEIPCAALLAKKATEKYLRAIERTDRDTGTIWEYYTPEHDRQGAWAHKDFVGWSANGPIHLLIQDVLGFEVEGDRHRLTWTILNLSRHGIRRLRVGSSIVSLEASQREDGETVQIHAKVEAHAVDLRLRDGVRRKTVFLKPGSHLISF